MRHGLQLPSRGPRPALLLPPDLRDWPPAGHLAWFVLDVVDQLDLGPFLRGYRADGHGHPAYDPKLLGVLLYGYAIGVRSSRQIERRCTEDLAFRVLAGNQTSDHVTIARFRVRHQQALAAEADQREDLLHGQARGNQLPEVLASKAGRLARLRQAKASSRPRRPSANAATSSGSRSWPPRPAPRANNPGRISSRGAVTRRPTPTRPPMSPTLTATSCPPGVAASRATTPRRSPPWSR
jgi:transposase